MELRAITIARVIAFIPTEELDPLGKVNTREFMPALVEKYGFLKYPTNYEDFDESKGITLEGGRWNDTNIDKVVIYRNGLQVDTRSSTKDSEQILEESLTWAATNYGLTFNPDMIRRKVYLSELLFSSEVSLDFLNPKLKDLTAQLAESVSRQLGVSLPYETFGITFHFDPFVTKYTPANVRIERLMESPFSENKYYSIAPIHTDEHLKFLEDFEAVLKG
ncbi:MAG TPA: hypothetical protein VGC66_15900 [Pyrinomonadaceae bacterium]|jgi:hypothetical protein